jgi:hypothetical protein
MLQDPPHPSCSGQVLVAIFRAYISYILCQLVMLQGTQFSHVSVFNMRLGPKISVSCTGKVQYVQYVTVLYYVLYVQYIQYVHCQQELRVFISMEFFTHKSYTLSCMQLL